MKIVNLIDEMREYLSKNYSNIETCIYTISSVFFKIVYFDEKKIYFTFSQMI